MPPTTTGSESIGLRLRVGDADQGGPIDGAWWPRSRDLRLEAGRLITGLGASFGQIRRILYSRPDWDLGTDGRVVQWLDEPGGVPAGSYASDDTHVVIVQTASGRRLRLLVIPPDTHPAEAMELFDAACDENDVRSAGQLLGEEWEHQGAIGRDIWDDDPGM